MSSTPVMTFSGKRLVPIFNPKEALKTNVALAASQTLAMGTILGELAATPGTYKAYSSAQVADPSTAPTLGSPTGSDGTLAAGVWTFGYTEASTSTFTGNTTNASATIAAVSSFLGLAVGQPITGTNVPTGATIASLNPVASTLTISQPATGTATATTFTVVTGESRLSPTATATVGATNHVPVTSTVTLPSGVGVLRWYGAPAPTEDLQYLGAVGQNGAAFSILAPPPANAPLAPAGSTLYAASDGSQIARAILARACTTDGSGNITAEGEFGQTRQDIDVFIGGASVFRIEDLNGLDQKAAADMGMRVVQGSIGAGKGLIRF